MARRSGWRAGVGALLALAAPAAAAQSTKPDPATQPAPASTVSGVTVNGQKDEPLVDRSSQYVREHLPTSVYSDQFPRFRDDICTKVIGLPDGFNAFISRRIVAVAKQVGAPVAKAADCRANVNVIFTAQPQALISDIAKRKDILLGFYYSHAQFQGLSAFDHPIEARYVTRVRDPSGASKLEVHDPTSWLDPPGGRAGSRLSNGMSTEIVHSLIIADANKAAGEKIDSIADTIAVLALARWQGIRRCSSMPTILNRLAADCDDPPEAATPEDLALLKALYSVSPRELGSQQREPIASAIRKAHEAASASK